MFYFIVGWLIYTTSITYGQIKDLGTITKMIQMIKPQKWGMRHLIADHYHPVERRLVALGAAIPRQPAI